jgi:hypothetical protein
MRTTLTIGLLLTVAASASAQNQAKNPTPRAGDRVGMFTFRSAAGGYLQAYTGGVLHASQGPNQDDHWKEETWILVVADPAKRYYGLMNYRTHFFISKKPGNCAYANTPVLSRNEIFELIPSDPQKVVDGTIIRAVVDWRPLKAYRPGKNSECGGEVFANEGIKVEHLAARQSSDFDAMWVMEKQTKDPTDQPNVIGDKFKDWFKNVSIADLLKVVGATVLGGPAAGIGAAGAPTPTRK